MAQITCKEDEFNRLKADWDGCQACSLHSHNTPTAQNPNGKAHGRGNLDAPILLVGEALGQEESRTGVVFYPDSPAGSKLEEILAHYNLTDRIFLANPVLCRCVNSSGKNCKPKPEHYEACAPRFKALVDIIQPQIIVALGSGALQALVGYTGPVFEVMGQSFQSRYGDVIAACHPMSYIYNKKEKLVKTTGGKRVSLRALSKEVWEHIASFAAL